MNCLTSFLITPLVPSGDLDNTQRGKSFPKITLPSLGIVTPMDSDLGYTQTLGVGDNQTLPHITFFIPKQRRMSSHMAIQVTAISVPA